MYTTYLYTHTLMCVYTRPNEKEKHFNFLKWFFCLSLWKHKQQAPTTHAHTHSHDVVKVFVRQGRCGLNMCVCQISFFGLNYIKATICPVVVPLEAHITTHCLLLFIFCCCCVCVCGNRIFFKNGILFVLLYKKVEFIKSQNSLNIW